MKEITLRDILTSYERKREQSERELEERKKKVYSRIPEIKEIDDEIGSIGLKLAKLVLLNPSDKDKILQETKTRMNDLKFKK